eukprot:1141146-Pelagomonas_calceolata.AAC.3
MGRISVQMQLVPVSFVRGRSCCSTAEQHKNTFRSKAQVVAVTKTKQQALCNRQLVGQSDWFECA